MHSAHQADIIFDLSPVLFAGSLFVLPYFAALITSCDVESHSSRIKYSIQ